MAFWEEPSMFPDWEPVIHTPIELWFSRRDSWLAEGVTQGFCTDAYCSSHDTAPISQEEAAQFEDGLDDCIYSTRLFTSPEEHRKVS